MSTALPAEVRHTSDRGETDLVCGALVGARVDGRIAGVVAGFAGKKTGTKLLKYSIELLTTEQK